MNTKASFAAIALIACATLSCSEDGLTGLAGDLVGTWNLTKAEFTNVADTTQRADLIQQGWVVTIAFRSNGRFSWHITEPGVAAYNEDGAWSVDGSDVVLISDVDPDAVVRCTSEVEQGVVTLTTLNAEYNLDGIPGDDAARLIMVLVKTT